MVKIPPQDCFYLNRRIRPKPEDYTYEYCTYEYGYLKMNGLIVKGEFVTLLYEDIDLWREFYPLKIQTSPIRYLRNKFAMRTFEDILQLVRGRREHLDASELNPFILEKRHLF